jgi:hypothetical protein
MADTKSDIKNLTIVSGDLLDAKERYLVQQNNCVTNKAAHLAQSVFTRFPYADIYQGRTKHDTPGQILVKGDGVKNRFVVSMLAQYYPGKSKWPTDKPMFREEWFQTCLNHLGKLPNLDSIAMPYNIGCGAAGGDWSHYLKMIQTFALNHPTTQITLYKL